MSQTIISSSKDNKGSPMSISEGTKDVLFNEIPHTVGSFSYKTKKKHSNLLRRSNVESRVGGEMRVSGQSLETKDEMTRNLHINRILENISRATSEGDVALVKALNNSLRILKSQGTDTQNLNLFQTKKAYGVDAPLATNDSKDIPDGRSPEVESPDLSNSSRTLRPNKGGKGAKHARGHHATVITRRTATSHEKVRKELFSILHSGPHKNQGSVLRKRRVRPIRGGMASDIAISTQNEASHADILSHKNDPVSVEEKNLGSTSTFVAPPSSPVVEHVKPLEKRVASPDGATERLNAATKALDAIMSNVRSGEDMAARLMSPFGFHIKSDLMTSASHPEDLPTKKSWREFLDSGDMSQFAHDLMTMSEEDFITKSVPEYVNPSNPSSWSSVSSFNANEIFNSPNAVYGLTSEQRGEVSSLLKNLGIIDQTVDMNLAHKKYGVAPSYLANYQDYFEKYPKVTVHMYHGEVRSRVAMADKEISN